MYTAFVLMLQVLRCRSIAALKVIAITELIQNALQNDAEARKTGKSGTASLSTDVDKVTAVVNRLSNPVDVQDAEREAKMKISQESDSDSEMAVASENEHVTVLDSGLFLSSVTLFIDRLINPLLSFLLTAFVQKSTVISFIV
jgi:hypothetical protein